MTYKPEWGPGTDIGCRVYHSAAQSISNASLTALAFDSERYDTDGMHDTSSNNSRITFARAGKYLVGFTVTFPLDVDGIRVLKIRKNGSTVIAEDAKTASNKRDHSQTLNTLALFAAGDYIEFLVYQTSGGNLDVNSAARYTPEAWAQKVDRAG